MSHSKKGLLTLQCVQRGYCHTNYVATNVILPNKA